MRRVTPSLVIGLLSILLASYAIAHGNEKHVMGTVTKIDRRACASPAAVAAA